MESNIRKKLYKCIEIPSFVKVKRLIKNIKGNWSRKSSPVKPLDCDFSSKTVQNMYSPLRPIPSSTLLSQIEEDSACDEKSPYGSNDSSFDSVSPWSDYLKVSEYVKLANVYQISPTKQIVTVNTSNTEKFNNSISNNPKTEEAALDYLQALGKNLRRYFNPETWDSSKSRQIMRRWIKKVKFNPISRRDSQSLIKLSSQLMKLESKIGKEEKLNKLETKTYFKQLCPINTSFRKRARFRTWDDNYSNILKPKISKKENSIKLENFQWSYDSSFKNYSLQMYDETKKYETKDNSEIKELKLLLNPCLPVDPNERKESYNSHNPFQLDSLEENEVIPSQLQGSFWAKFSENFKFNVDREDTYSDSALKAKRSRILTSENDSQYSKLEKKSNKRKKHKASRKTSISNSEFNSFYLAYDNHAKAKNGSMLTSSVRSSVSSQIVSPDSNSLKKRLSKESNSSAKNKNSSSILIPIKMNAVSERHVIECSKVPYPVWKMASLTDSLKDIEINLN